MPNKCEFDMERNMVMCVDEIQRLRAENDTLRKESEFYRKQCDMQDEWRDKIEAELAALREAVAWERECEQLDFWGVAYALCRRYPGNYIDAVRADFYAIRDSARAEVDLLIANEGAADCEGEG